MLKKTLLSLFLILAALPAFAEDAKPAAPAPAPAAEVAPVSPSAKIPDLSNMLFVQNLRKAGATLYYLGEALGMNGWFAMKDREIQIFYTSVDNKAIMVGALLSADGANISQQQLALFAKDHPDIMEAMKGGPMAQPAPDMNQAPASNAEQMFADFAAAPHITAGKPGAPLILMLMDINCPHCHKTWKALEKAVDSGKLSVNLIPIPAMGGQSAKEEAVWLASKDPVEVFKKKIAGDEKILSGTPGQDKLADVAKNMELVQKWKIQQTPTILYRGKNGKVRLITGEPESADVIISDIGG
jgi:protein-disulfide isomerase